MSEPEWKVEVWDEFSVTARTRTSGKSWMDYEVYSHYGWDDDDRPVYTKKQDGPGALEPTESLDNALPLMTGTIRFDGCSHNHFGEGGYIHGCSLKDIAMLSDVFKRLWRIALESVDGMKDWAE